MKAVTHPDWPHGMTADEFLSVDGPWQDALGCHSCGRIVENVLVGHDGMCPVPFLANAMTAVATLRARLEGLQQDVIGIVAMYQMTAGMHPRVRQALEEACARSTAPDDSGGADQEPYGVGLSDASDQSGRAPQDECR